MNDKVMALLKEMFAADHAYGRGFYWLKPYNELRAIVDAEKPKTRNNWSCYHGNSPVRCRICFRSAEYDRYE
jgi:hypothetical protein